MTNSLITEPWRQAISCVMILNNRQAELPDNYPLPSGDPEQVLAARVRTLSVLLGVSESKVQAKLLRTIKRGLAIAEAYEG